MNKLLLTAFGLALLAGCDETMTGSSAGVEQTDPFLNEVDEETDGFQDDGDMGEPRANLDEGVAGQPETPPGS